MSRPDRAGRERGRGGEHRGGGIPAHLGVVAAHVPGPVRVQVARVVDRAQGGPRAADLADRDLARAEVDGAGQVVGRGGDGLVPRRIDATRSHPEGVVDELRGAVGAEAGLGAGDGDEHAGVEAHLARARHEGGAGAGEGASPCRPGRRRGRRRRHRPWRRGRPGRSRTCRGSGSIAVAVPKASDAFATSAAVESGGGGLGGLGRGGRGGRRLGRGDGLLDEHVLAVDELATCCRSRSRPEP